MKILSLFDGMSCGYIALKLAGIPITEYHAFENDKYAIQASIIIGSDIIRHGEITVFTDFTQFKGVDFIIGGSPCQSLSIAKRQKESGLAKGSSSLFWEYARAIKEAKPKYFLLENVASMKKSDRDIISKELGVEPVLINSALVSGQQRNRLYWCNWKVGQPEDRNIYLKDVLEYGNTEKLKSYCITATYQRACLQDYFNKSQRQLVFNKPVRVATIGKGGQGERIYHIDGKSIALSANGGGRGAKTGLYEIGEYVRKLTPKECFRLQTVPEDVINRLLASGISDTQLYRIAGNGWTVEVIKHIFQQLTRGNYDR